MSDTESDPLPRPIPEDGPWGLKHIAGSDRQLATDAAKRAKLTIGEWLGEAIRAKVEDERADYAGDTEGYTVLAPGQTLLPAPDSGLSVREIGEAVEIAQRIAILRQRERTPRAMLLAAQRLLAGRLGGR
jgi:hypothetical protein